MATINCGNIKASQALRGESAYVTLSAAESLSVLPVLVVGQEVDIESSSATAYIDFIDTYGHSFKIRPAAPNLNCASDTPGLLKVDELITVTIS